jgi:hypothetical protein
LGYDISLPYGKETIKATNWYGIATFFISSASFFFLVTLFGLAAIGYGLGGLAKLLVFMLLPRS